MAYAGKCMVKQADRAAVQEEAARVAYSIQRAEEAGDGDSAGAHGLRGTFQALRFALGEAEDPVPPNITAGEDDDPVAESEFVEAIATYAEQFPGAEDETPKPRRRAKPEASGEDEG